MAPFAPESAASCTPIATPAPMRVSLLALPESSASVLYGLYDVLSGAGRLWSEMTGEAEVCAGMTVEIVSPSSEPFRCWGGAPVAPHASLAERPESDLVVISDFAIPIDFDPRGAWTAIDAGYSPNTQKDGIAASPVVEILAAIGLEHARPDQYETRKVRYAVWGHPLPPMLARAALAGADLKLPMRGYQFELDLSGKNKVTTFAQEEA